jgi:hypothetical protein
VDVPISFQNNSISAIDNILINYSRQCDNELSPIHNGLSDKDAQLISIHDVDFYVRNYNIQNVRKINKYSLADFNYNIGFVTGWYLR